MKTSRKLAFDALEEYHPDHNFMCCVCHTRKATVVRVEKIVKSARRKEKIGSKKFRVWRPVSLVELTDYHFCGFHGHQCFIADMESAPPDNSWDVYWGV